MTQILTLRKKLALLYPYNKLAKAEVMLLS